MHMPQPIGHQIGHCTQNGTMESIIKKIVPQCVKHPLPSQNNIHIRPCNACPASFIIFDQTNEGSHVVYHPDITSKFLHNTNFGTDLPPLPIEKDLNLNDDNNASSSTSSEEDYDCDGIDALLSSEYEGNEPEDDNVSTARTGPYNDCRSPDSCSSYEVLSKKRQAFSQECSGIQRLEKKRKRILEMVRSLRGIVPGAERMSTFAVLDESVRYLKSLVGEAQKLGDNKSFED